MIRTLAALAVIVACTGSAMAEGACDNATAYGPGTLIGGAIGAIIGKNVDNNFGAAIGGVIASQIGRCAESAIVTRRENRQQRAQRTGQPSPAWIETDNRGNQMVCQNALVQVTMPTGIVLTDSKKLCQGISGQVITSSN